jgi:hypothetical protein
VTQEAEIRRITVWSLPGQIVCKTLSRTNPTQEKRAGRVAQDISPEFKPQYHTKKEGCGLILFRHFSFYPGLSSKWQTEACFKN